jgi:spore germination protein
MGIPNYGYDWPLPFEKGTTKAKTIGNVEAVRLAIKYGVPIQFDEYAQSPFFQYTEDNVTHEVWFEDARSIQAKLNLIEEYGIKGAGYWQIMQLFRVNWLLTEARYTIEKQL